MPDARPRTIEVLAFPNVQLLDVTGPIQVFATANEHAAANRGPPKYAIRIVARNGGPILASAGVTLATFPLLVAD